MGRIYLTGADSVEVDISKATNLIMDGANNGEPVAEFILSKMYFEGIGVQPDKVLGKKWLEKAATHHKMAKHKLKELHI